MESDLSQKGKKVSLMKQRYEDNPFATEDGFRVPIRAKSEVIMTSGPVTLNVGGEHLEAAEIRRVKTVDTEPFVKVFVGELDRFYNLTPTALRIVTCLIIDIGKIRIGDGDKVMIREHSISKSMAENGQKPPSTGAFYKAMHELIEKGFVAPSTEPPLYFINPAIFFNGDRVRFVTEIRRKKLTKQQKLEDQGQSRLALDNNSEGEV
jgi:hypothetical protein